MPSAPYSGIFILLLFVVNPIICGPLRAANDNDLSDKGTIWKKCPTYGTFAGRADQDHNCCVQNEKCAFNATDIDSDLEELVFRTKRATIDETQMLVTRQQNPQSRYEVSLCQVQSEVIKPVFGVRADSDEQVQVLQILPVFEQRAVIDNCIVGPTLLVKGECRQHFKTEEFFTLSVGAGGKVVVKREGLLVHAGCSVVVDLSPVRQKLQLEFARPTRAQYGQANSGIHVETVPVNSYTDLEHQYDVDDQYIEEKESQIDSENDASGRLPAPDQNIPNQFYQTYDQNESHRVGFQLPGFGIPANRQTPAHAIPGVGVYSNPDEIKLSSDEPERPNAVTSDAEFQFQYGTLESEGNTAEFSKVSSTAANIAEFVKVSSTAANIAEFVKVSSTAANIDEFVKVSSTAANIANLTNEIPVSSSTEDTKYASKPKPELDGTNNDSKQNNSISGLYPDDELNAISDIDGSSPEFTVVEESAPSAHIEIPIPSSTEQYSPGHLSGLPLTVGVPIYVPEGEYDPVKRSMS